jgi:hypothetical protein
VHQTPEAGKDLDALVQTNTSQKDTGYGETDVAESKTKQEEKETRIRRMTR